MSNARVVLTSVLLLGGEAEQLLLEGKVDGECCVRHPALQPARSPLSQHDEWPAVEHALAAQQVAAVRPRGRFFGFNGSGGVGFNQAPFYSGT
jgi:hypothetical protein